MKIQVYLAPRFSFKFRSFVHKKKPMYIHNYYVSIVWMGIVLFIKQGKQ